MVIFHSYVSLPEGIFEFWGGPGATKQFREILVIISMVTQDLTVYYYSNSEISPLRVIYHYHVENGTQAQSSHQQRRVPGRVTYH